VWYVRAVSLPPSPRFPERFDHVQVS
jgi:hypothetical protein